MSCAPAGDRRPGASREVEIATPTQPAAQPTRRLRSTTSGPRDAPVAAGGSACCGRTARPGPPPPARRPAPARPGHAPGNCRRRRCRGSSAAPWTLGFSLNRRQQRPRGPRQSRCDRWFHIASRFRDHVRGECLGPSAKHRPPAAACHWGADENSRRAEQRIMELSAELFYVHRRLHKLGFGGSALVSNPRPCGRGAGRLGAGALFVAGTRAPGGPGCRGSPAATSTVARDGRTCRWRGWPGCGAAFEAPVEDQAVRWPVKDALGEGQVPGLHRAAARAGLR